MPSSRERRTLLLDCTSTSIALWSTGYDHFSMSHTRIPRSQPALLAPHSVLRALPQQSTTGFHWTTEMTPKTNLRDDHESQ
ncbi:uncharacterized protein N7473_004941 [Penicillium subrubescens]|uniref:uncharacterized protein n=1 Tax=Penicillium subrubescens TaxID=1316194 RepID=UPI002544EA70|nr:uncharacterized protein N7473_004941 [Penicillium subrubescens]KAJ5900871.1 hypothetical protein N7473_004941 [Penicillium subrubescens]